MKKELHHITCPNCNHSIPIDDTLYQKLDREYRQKLDNTYNLEKEKLREEIEKNTNLKISEKNQLIESLKNQLKGMQRKIEQTSVSQQAQGEAQELMLQEFLSRVFPLDTIKEVPKGMKGADCIQVVNTREKQNLGSLLFMKAKGRKAGRQLGYLNSEKI